MNVLRKFYLLFNLLRQWCFYVPWGRRYWGGIEFC